MMANNISDYCNSDLLRFDFLSAWEAEIKLMKPNALSASLRLASFLDKDAKAYGMQLEMNHYYQI